MNLKSGSLTQHGEQGIYWLDFSYKGVRHRESSCTANRERAIAWAEQRVAKIQTQILIAQAAEHTVREVVYAYLTSTIDMSIDRAERGAFFSESWGTLRISEIGGDIKEQLAHHFQDAETLNASFDFFKGVLGFAHQSGWLKKLPKYKDQPIRLLG